MLVYRIAHKNYSNRLYAGNKVVYFAKSIPLAFLENMVRRQGVGFNHDFEIMIVEVPEDLEITSVDFARLKKGWRQFNNYSYCQPIGDDWYNGGKPPLLKLLRSSTGVFELPTKRATCGLQQDKVSG